MINFNNIKKPLEPNEDNIIESLLNDSLNRKNFVISLVKQLLFSSTNITLALDGKWGSGKTFLLKQVEYLIKSVNESIMNKININHPRIDNLIQEITGDNKLEITNIVYFNAWQNDQYENPLIILLIEIINQLEIANVDDTIIEKLKDKVQKVVRSISLNVGIFNFGSFDELDYQNDSKLNNEFFNSLNQKQYLNEINEILAGITYYEDPEAIPHRLIIIVDELDRCEPEFAINLLEQIKMYLNNNNITVIFGINRIEFDSIIESYYGTNFDSVNYLDRFFDLTLQVPYFKPSEFISLVLEDEKLNNEDVKTAYLNVVKSIANATKMSLRNIHRYLTIAIWFGSELERSWRILQLNLKSTEFYFTYFYFAPVIIYYQLFKPNKLEDFLTGKESDFFINLIFEKVLTRESSNFQDYILDYYKGDEKTSKDEKIKLGLKNLYIKICKQSDYTHSDDRKPSRYESEADPLNTVISHLNLLLMR